MSNAIMPYITRVISSDNLKNIKRSVYKCRRYLKGDSPTLDIFLRIDDPYSYLLVQVIEPFLARFNVQANFHTVLELQPDMFPAMDMWHEYAGHDAGHLAKLYKLVFPIEHTVVKDREILEAATTLLLKAESNSDFIHVAKEVFNQVWHGHFNIDPNATPLNKSSFFDHLKSNQALLAKKGHYFGAMINFESEWYWGLDRLDHLETRLIKQGLATHEDIKIEFNLTYKDFCNQTLSPALEAEIDKTKPLTIYWSARSPYSYIGLERAVKLSEHYKIPLIIKPVLPMMMRGMNVPTVKKMYIFLDTKREAQKLGLPYGYVADPLGPAVERCYALLSYARNHNKLQDFLLSFARAVNTQGIRAETDTGMKIIIERCGLNWETASSHINNTYWKKEVNDNLKEMYQQGCWGVPSFCYDGNIFWGQDRIGMIEQLIINKG
jgi:2-hydroxychromene-2-carboxylate isomerase